MAATLILSAGGERPPWARDVPEARLHAAEPGVDGLVAAAGEASCVLVDAAVPDPVGVARRVHRATPAVQVVLVAPEERRAELERAMLFAPGLGEVWITEPAQVNAGLLERAGTVTRQRRRYRATHRELEAGMARVEPRRDARALVSDAYLAALLEVLPEPVVSVDESGKVLSWNPAAERTLGIGSEKAVGQPLAELVNPEPRDAFDALLAQAADAPAAADVGFGRADGERGMAEVAAVPVKAGGHLVRAVVLHDVTRQREAQVELEAQATELENQAAELQVQAAELEVLNAELTTRTQDLEQALATRSRFYAAMSHELRTPINAIIGYNTLILDGIFGEVAPRQEDGLRRAQRAAKHLMELVNDVLDLAKIEAGRIEIQVEPTRLTQLVDELLDTVRPLAEERGTRMVTSMADGCPEIQTDPRRARQILLNLLSNAAKFGAGGTVTITCTAVGRGIAVEVQDHGPGIPPEEHERIFEEFVQLGGTEGSGGTGLGLPISRRLATLLGGSLTVRSAPGEGSTFRLELPETAPALPAFHGADDTALLPEA
jgi:PAS domain S-box-containing protein